MKAEQQGSVSQQSSNLVVMGRIVAPYGVLGWVKIKPDTEYLDGLLDYHTWYVGRNQSWKSIEVESAKTLNDVLAVKIAGVNDRDAAFALKGKLVAVPRDALPATGENEYYWSDLIGLKVKNLRDVDFGVVTDVFETGANDVLVVTEQEVKRERLIPFIGQVVINVDLAGGTMQVDWDAEF